jgi:hypothetical protein
VSDRNKQVSFAVDQETLDLINSMKKDLGATTASGVLRKALAIAKVATAQAAESDGILVLKGSTQPPEREIAIALRA